MKVIITPAKISGKVSAVTSKSDAHRLIIAAALADKPTKININSFSEDIFATMDAVLALGGKCVRSEDGITVFPIYKNTGSAVIDCRESGSTARFIMPLAAAVCKSSELSGRAGLLKRPFGELTAVLRQHGAVIDSDRLPVRISGGLRGGEYRIAGNISSQYITGLLFALPLLKQESRIILTTPLESAGYVDMTLDTLSKFGVSVRRNSDGYTVLPSDYASPGEISAEGDWSNAAFWIAADKICGGIEVFGLSSASHQGDKRICELLESTEIDASQIPDLVPILAVLAAAKKGVTVIKNAERLRIKESDRLFAMYKNINALGGDVSETEDGLVINGKGALTGGRVDSFNDHRVVMSMAVASCICTEKVTINGAEAADKSYPKFFEDFKRLGGVFDVLYDR